jgi:hypothetical protein
MVVELAKGEEIRLLAWLGRGSYLFGADRLE